MTQEDTLDDIISYQPQIIGLLNRIRDAHVLLSIKVDDDQHQYTSALIQTLPEKNTLLLDELYPHSGHDKVVVGSLLHVRTRLKGIDTQFDCRVSSIEDSSGVAAYHAIIPETIAYYQRRKQFRAPLDYQAEVYLRVQPRPGKHLIAQVFDVSLEGMGLYFDPAAAPLLEVKQQIKNVAIDFPGCPQFSTTLEIRSMRLNKAGNTLMVGTQFKHLLQRDKRHVQRYVATLDRQARQNRR